MNYTFLLFCFMLFCIGGTKGQFTNTLQSKNSVCSALWDMLHAFKSKRFSYREDNFPLL